VKRWKKNLLALLIAPLLLVLGEVGLRLLVPPPNPLQNIMLDIVGTREGFRAIYDERLFWRLPERKVPFQEPAARRALKVVCLADSVGAIPQEGNYPDQLGEILDQRLGRKGGVAVFNTSVPGYTSLQGRRLFSERIVQYGPDVVVIDYGWNDHWQSGNGIPDKLQRPLPAWMVKLLERSYLAGWLHTELQRRKQEDYQDVGPPETARVSPQDYVHNLETIVSVARQRGMMVILSTAPYLERGQHWLAVHRQYNELSRQVAAREGVYLLDLVSTFRARPELFAEPDQDQVHIGRRGARLVAQGLAEIILRHYREKRGE
jgi:lysophospholipase L1-like esterase